MTALEVAQVSTRRRSPRSTWSSTARVSSKRKVYRSVRKSVVHRRQDHVDQADQVERPKVYRRDRRRRQGANPQPRRTARSGRIRTAARHDPGTRRKALAVEVTQEADFYDLTGRRMETAAGVGKELGYRKEVSQIDLVLGVTNPYVYNGTAYNTYQTSTPWVNSQSNPLSDYNDVDDSLDLFRQMTDPRRARKSSSCRRRFCTTHRAGWTSTKF